MPFTREFRKWEVVYHVGPRGKLFHCYPNAMSVRVGVSTFLAVYISGQPELTRLLKRYILAHVPHQRGVVRGKMPTLGWFSVNFVSGQVVVGQERYVLEIGDNIKAKL